MRREEGERERESNVDSEEGDSCSTWWRPTSQFYIWMKTNFLWTTVLREYNSGIIWDTRVHILWLRGNSVYMDALLCTLYLWKLYSQIFFFTFSSIVEFYLQMAFSFRTSGHKDNLLYWNIVELLILDMTINGQTVDSSLGFKKKKKFVPFSIW